ncbi:MAG TPA: prenyltransferase/squalene oxidase repeat-containing protein [Herpetosiphonaceae bacterium]|nr:prenyltransferase/squalene oxidase repeat-containing protein [Herpetosiphonaceae bacterium]
MIVDILVNDLRALIKDIGKDGGLMSPSIYDTAQVLRLYPAEGRIWPAVNWLLDQQQADGGWGSPSLPLSRAVPTLAAIMALRRYCERRTTIDALEKGKTFLRRQLCHWNKPLPDDLPVGMEVLLPYLFEEAAREEFEDERAGVPIKVRLDLSLAPYKELIALGERKRAKIRRYRPGPGTTASYSWEAWGEQADPAILDATGGVGHSPAATAAWLRAANRNPALADEIMRAEDYLAGAARATSEHTPGIYPTAWPITRFEQSFCLYALVVGDLLELPKIQDVLQPQIADLGAALTPTGLGFSDDFMPDGDDTAAAVAVLLNAKAPVDLQVMSHYEDEKFCIAYPGEDQPSISVTARALHALDIADKDKKRDQAQEQSILRWVKTCLEHQQLDGSWLGDKWNSSWLYTTCHTMIALKNSGHADRIREAIGALRVNQFPDGGWGLINRSTTVETAYAVLALHNLRDHSAMDADDLKMLRRGYRWLMTHYRPFRMKEYKCWLNKEIFCPQRIDRAYELAALLAVTLGGVPR